MALGGVNVVLVRRGVRRRRRRSEDDGQIVKMHRKRVPGCANLLNTEMKFSARACPGCIGK
jgi:hypothetical protein